MIKKIVLVLLGLLIISILGLTSIGLANKDFTFMKTIVIDEERSSSIEEIEKIKISAVSGNINFFTVAENNVKVKLSGKQKCMMCYAETALKFNKSGSTLELINQTRLWGIVGFSQLKMDVYLPLNYFGKLEIKTVSGDIYLSSMNLMNITVNTQSGDIGISDITANAGFNLNSVSGNITLNNIIGNVTVDTVSGNVQAHGIAGDFDADTVSGNVALKVLSREFSIMVATTSGDVKIILNPEAHFSFSLKSTSGNLSIDYMVLLIINERRYLKGHTGESDNSVNVSTTSGNIKITDKR